MIPMPFIEAHMHADSRSGEEFERLAAAGCEGIVAVAGPAGGFSSSAGLDDYFRRQDRLDRKRIERAGLKAWIALGLHPVGIPEAGLDEVLTGLAEMLKKHHAHALGEVGLERGGDLEERVLSRCFAVAKELDLPLILHTPRHEKRKMLNRSLELLAQSGLSPERVLADHLDGTCLDLASQAGCWLGLSVHPAKLSARQAAEMVANHGTERIIVTSDTGSNPSYLFALPAFIAAGDAQGLPEAQIQSCIRDHALAWLRESS